MPHVPQRMCVICRQRLAKGELTRHVVGARGLLVDEAQRLPGRGYYVCAAAGCREKMRLFVPRAPRKGKGKAAQAAGNQGGKQ